MTDVERARSALHSLDPSCDRETWVKIGMAAKAAGLSRDEWTEWSRGGQNFQSDRDCAAVWQSIDVGGISAGTLFYEAQRAGWQDRDTPRLNGHKPRRQSGAAAGGQRPAGSDIARAAALALWERSLPATADHPYIAAKGGTADGLRVASVADTEKIVGHSIAGWLVVPVWSPSGKLRTVQLVPGPGAGSKLNYPGATFDDGYFIVGGIAPTSPLYVVEGIGQAWACWKATGHAAAVTFGAGRTATVCEALGRSGIASKLVLVPDRGKEQQAADIAQRYGLQWAQLPDDKPANYDAADLAREYGHECLAQLLAKPLQAPQRYQLLSPADVVARPPLQWLVRCVLPAQGLACIYGKSGSGKSFVAMDLCAAIASGERWFNYRVKAAPVVYVALEGEAGFRQRVLAWEKYRDRTMPAGLHFIMQPFDLRKPDDLRDLPAAVKASGYAGGVLVIDTLNRASTGADENTSADMGELIEAAKTLERLCGGVVLLVHHSGKDEAKGLRGHSSLHGALDAAIEVTRQEGQRSWSTAKAKDGRDDVRHSFQLEEVSLGTDDEGEPVSSCVVRPDNAKAEMRRLTPPKSGHQRVAWHTLQQMLRRAAGPRPDDAPERMPQGRPFVALEAAVLAVAAALVCDPKRRRERAQSALTGLHARGLLVIEGSYVWAA